MRVLLGSLCGSSNPNQLLWLALGFPVCTSLFRLFKFLFAPLKSSSSINICWGSIGPNRALLQLLFTDADVGVPPLCGLSHIIPSYFQHFPSAALPAFPDLTTLFCPVVQIHNLTFQALCNGEKFRSHTRIMNSSPATFRGI